MNIFSEIYGVYFRTVTKIIENEKITEAEINRIIHEEAFKDSMLFLPQKIIPDKDNHDWGLFKRNEDGSISGIIKNIPVRVFTDIQKQWIKSKLTDPRFRLFFDDETLKRLEKRLEGVSLLYNRQHFRYTDIFNDGDDFSNENYRKNFREILLAIKNHEILDIEFITGKNLRKHSYFIPLKIEYSHKNDKFRMYCHAVKGNRIINSGVINIGRIICLRNTHKVFNENIQMDDYFEGRKCREPVVIKVTTERNAVERFMMEFASYEKYTERNPENGECIVKLWYDIYDETELTIRLISFGPVIEIMKPQSIRKQVKERISRQYKLLFSENENPL